MLRLLCLYEAAFHKRVKLVFSGFAVREMLFQVPVTSLIYLRFCLNLILSRVFRKCINVTLNRMEYCHLIC